MVRYAQKPEKDEKEKKVTFVAKEATRCPVCDAVFHREELFSGRVNAGDLTDELHRTYIPMAAYGEIHPLVYDVTVCPSCWYAAWKHDFSEISTQLRDALQDGIAARVEAAQRVFDPIDFNNARGLGEGAASYYLAMMSYELFPKEYAPTFKKGLAALRAAWLCNELETRRPGENFGYVAGLFYRKARFLYKLAVEHEQKGTERLSTVKWLGPDTDKSYGFEGVLYVASILELKFGPKEDPAVREESLRAAKRSIAKMFGLGRSSKNKPGPLLDKARDLYELLKTELQQDDEEGEE
jgi:uncharacterized protein (DUF2225 family)